MDSHNGQGGQTPRDLAKANSMGGDADIGRSIADRNCGDDPVKITAIYDNAGATIDRYTVVTDQTHSQKYLMALGVGANPEDFSQWTGVTLGSHLGNIIPFEKLSAKLQAHIAKRVWCED